MSRAKSYDAAKIDTLAKSKLPALGIDLGGTKIRAAAVRDYEVITEPKQVPTPEGREHIIEALVDLVSEFKTDILMGVGIATAGIVNCDTGEIIGSTGNLPGWSGTPLKKVLESKILLPVHVENDANAAGYAEARIEALRKKRCVVTVTLGTGIGGGIVLHGRLFRGSNWAAGEVGHIKIAQDNKRLCTCGLIDCWEAYGSGRGLIMTAQEMLEGVTIDQSRLVKEPGTLTTYDVFSAAKEDDLMAKKIVERWHEHIAHGLVNLAHVLNPDCFVITGGLSEFVDFQLLHDMVADRCLPRVADAIEIRQSAIQGQAGIIGAAQFVIDELLTPRS
ncbi:MAG: ROK family protein [Candidatus Obscuribacterales bacterium]|nr:ROK family protein [Candidatus Obscuribacterales bacterium]